jgi:hypothetical protein
MGWDPIREIFVPQITPHGELIYLASPYTDTSADVRQQRFEAACAAAAKLMAGGRIVYSPIAHTHPIARLHDLPVGWAYWKILDRAMLSRCTELMVLRLPGWRASEGVTAEIQIAKDLDLRISWLEA